ncbi:MAG TPA: hypothetical protein VKQ30_17945 [Ktedonobacterales bacterium]|nr:hypothetical protein [Ktedonobacterales bacterium]
MGEASLGIVLQLLAGGGPATHRGTGRRPAHHVAQCIMVDEAHATNMLQLSMVDVTLSTSAPPSAELPDKPSGTKDHAQREEQEIYSGRDNALRGVEHSGNAPNNSAR